jgi:membrane protease YdiL (CAAX protease family)
MRFSARMAASLPFLAVVLFFPLMARQGLGPLDFWWGMSLSIALLVGLGCLADSSLRLSLLRDWKEGLSKKTGLAVLSALGLYGIFWAGNAASRAVLPSAGKEISLVYGFKQSAALLRIGLLIFFVIGPGEELFWRGFVQRRWQQKLGRGFGWVLASMFYAAVHVGSGNFMLVLSALVCGLYWGALYSRFKSTILVAISHSVWDMLIFVFFPLG